MKRYRDVAYLIGSDYEEFLAAINDDDLPHCVTDTWQSAAQAYLSQWDHGDNGTVHEGTPWGNTDYVLTLDWIGVPGYVINHNPHYGYVGYTEVIEDDD